MQHNSICLVGASGLVGSALKKQLKEKKIAFDEYVKNGRAQYTLAFFCTPSEVSQELAPLFLKHNCTIIDASSAFRKTAPLIIPQINGHLIEDVPIIASPNCTTTFLSLALFPLHQLFTLKSIITSTYQAASGGGKKMLEEYKKGYALRLHESPHNEEEEKMCFETQKILNHSVNMSTTCVRIYQKQVHALSIFATFVRPVDLKAAMHAIEHTQGLEYDEKATIKSTENSPAVKIKRLRKSTFDNSLELFVMGDQLLKGSSTNMLEIAEIFLNNKKCAGFSNVK
jgi:aspartate-semialdehyde dehydrogenase